MTRHARDVPLTLAAMAVALTLGATPSSAAAAGRTGQEERSRPFIPSTAMAAQDVETHPAMEIDDGKNCGQSRKRLFVEGEGWIVRRVTTCY
ncbi:hypothetical protein [Microvirga brassicacearum]|nr:hypothetical protein [Microvirga brassicacearum]